MIIRLYSNKISRSGSIDLKSPQSQQLTNKQLQRFPPHSSPRRAYKRPVLKPKAAPDPVSQTLAALKEHVMLMGWEVVDGLMRGWWCWFIHYIMILYDGVMLSVVFLSFSGSLSSRHALSFLPIGPPSSHLVSDQGLSACILAFENIYIINMIQHQINSSSTDRHEPNLFLPLCQHCQWSLRFVSSPEQSLCDFPVFVALLNDSIVIERFSTVRDFAALDIAPSALCMTVASGKERGFIFLDVWTSIADVPNAWHLSFSPFEKWFQPLSWYQLFWKINLAIYGVELGHEDSFLELPVANWSQSSDRYVARFMSKSLK